MLGHGSTLEEAAIGVTVRALRVVANRIESGDLKGERGTIWIASVEELIGKLGWHTRGLSKKVRLSTCGMVWNEFSAHWRATISSGENQSS